MVNDNHQYIMRSKQIGPYITLLWGVTYRMHNVTQRSGKSVHCAFVRSRIFNRASVHRPVYDRWSRDTRKNFNGILPWQNTWHLAPQFGSHFCELACSVTEQEMGRQGGRREIERVGRIGPPTRNRAALPTGRVWFSPGALSAMHRRLETFLTNHIYIWKVRQLPRLRFTSSTLYESLRRSDWTIHPSTSPLPATLNYFRLIAPGSYELLFSTDPSLPLLATFWVSPRGIRVRDLSTQFYHFRPIKR